MTGQVTIQAAGPAITIQDLGRPGLVAQGLSRGGAMDRFALLEAAALLGSAQVTAAFEIAGFGGVFTPSITTRIALTGAPMRATVGGRVLAWNATHLIAAGVPLEIGSCEAGSYGYLSFAGGLAPPDILGSYSAHLTAGFGGFVQSGDRIAIGADPDPKAAQQRLDPESRFTGGPLRMVAGPQTDLFDASVIAQFLAAKFQKSNRSNRQGIGLAHPDLKFASGSAAGLASDFIMPGDIQLTGDGVPYVLMAECQTTGGYPRIGTVIPDDLPRLAQAQPGTVFQFDLIPHEAALKLHRDEAALLADLRRRRQAVVRDPKDMADLLSYQLIDGVTAGDDLERN